MIMDMRLKERIVGAVVLVVAAVLFIPMVLDGPDTHRKVSQAVALPDIANDDDRRTVRIDLDAGDSQAEAQDVSSSAMPIEPATAAPAPVEDVAEPASESASAEPALQKPSVDQKPVAPKPVETAEGSPWTVQVGSFGQDSNAETLAAKLRKLGFPAYVSRFDDGAKVHHRVRVGGFPSREAAEAEAIRVRAKTGEPARPARNL